MYNWQHTDWPNFYYDLTKLQDILYQYAVEASTLKGAMLHIPNNLSDEALIDLMVKEALKTSEIEGEIIKPEDVRSSLQQQMGFFVSEAKSNDLQAINIAALMLSIKKSFADLLTEKNLYNWHNLIFSHINKKTKLNIGK